MPKLPIIDLKCVWRQSPPFINNRVIELTLPYKCPYGHDHTSKECQIYDLSSHEKVIETLPNPVSTKTILKKILDYYILDPNHPHINIVIFKGDFMIPENFTFINEFISILDQARVGMYVGTETYGSEDKTELPKLLSKQIIDELMVKMVVYPELTDEVKKTVTIALNSLSQAISAVREIKFIDDEPKRLLEKTSISFLFTKDSNINVLIAYIRALYQAFQKDKDIFTSFDIYLRSDGSEPKGMLEDAYCKIIEGFEPDRVYMVPIPKEKEKKECIFFDS